MRAHIHAWSYRLAVIGGMAAFGLASPAGAEVALAKPDTMRITGSVVVKATPSAVIGAVGRIGSWWDPHHSYSGAGKNLSIDLVAGGCYCEKWEGGSVEHGRVIAFLPDKLVRLQAALGPLQKMAVNAVLDIAVKAEGEGTTISFTYLVNGSSASDLDKIAPGVDAVLMGNLQRLGRYADGGTP